MCCFVLVFDYSGVVLFCLSVLCLVCPMLPVTLDRLFLHDCPFNVYFIHVPESQKMILMKATCTLYCCEIFTNWIEILIIDIVFN